MSFDWHIKFLQFKSDSKSKYGSSYSRLKDQILIENESEPSVVQRMFQNFREPSSYTNTLNQDVTQKDESITKARFNDKLKDYFWLNN